MQVWDRQKRYNIIDNFAKNNKSLKQSEMVEAVIIFVFAFSVYISILRKSSVKPRKWAPI